MSKHIWRGRGAYNMMLGKQVNEPDHDPANCTVIEDAACFPVKEAMRLVKAVKTWTLRGQTINYADALQVMYDAWFAYDRAVAKMKVKNKKGKK